MTFFTVEWEIYKKAEEARVDAPVARQVVCWMGRYDGRVIFDGPSSQINK